ncbi:MAG: hypothetical protein K2O67_02000, partial [Clostridia bacterium]|nr:hypothetical protein [Clostridia bacterium]
MNTLAVLLATVLTGLMTVSVIPAKVDYCEFSSTKPIVQERQLSDYNGNKFKLYELEGGYAIYSLADEQETFIEGSYETQSPYINYFDKEIKYLGPGNYFYEDHGKTFDIINQSRVTANLQNASYQLNESIEPYSSVMPPNINETDIDIEGYTI